MVNAQDSKFNGLANWLMLNELSACYPGVSFYLNDINPLGLGANVQFQVIGGHLVPFDLLSHEVVNGEYGTLMHVCNNYKQFMLRWIWSYSQLVRPGNRIPRSK